MRVGGCLRVRVKVRVSVKVRVTVRGVTDYDGGGG